MNPEFHYYEQESIWDRPDETYQGQVQRDVLQLIPTDTTSILDAGCGNGLITNAVSESIRVAGLDISREALKHVTRERVQGSVTDIPFPDGAFDLVMANDVIEHLNDEDHARAIQEIERVASKYIIVTVPHGEQLELNTARCSDCGAVYHINYHKRSYSATEMQRLFAGVFPVVELRYSGDFNLPLRDPTLWLRHSSGDYACWEHTVCPECGSRRQLSCEKDFKARVLDSTRTLAWSKLSEHRAFYLDRTEIIGLYSKEPVRHDGCRNSSKVKRGDLLRVEFDNPLQSIYPGFPLSSEWARFFVPPDGRVTGEGISRGGNAPEPVLVPIRFPRRPEKGDLMLIEAWGDDEDSSIALFGLDGLSGDEIAIQLRHTIAGSRSLLCEVPLTWKPDPFGWAVSLYLYGATTVRSLQLLPRGVPGAPATFASFEPGHNVIYQSGSHPQVSWGFLVPTAGSYPHPFDSPRLFSTPIAGSSERPEELAAGSLLELTQALWDDCQRREHELRSLLGEANDRFQAYSIEAQSRELGLQRTLTESYQKIGVLSEDARKREAELQQEVIEAHLKTAAAAEDAQRMQQEAQMREAQLSQELGDARQQIAVMGIQLESITEAARQREASLATELAQTQQREASLATELAQTQCQMEELQADLSALRQQLETMTGEYLRRLGFKNGLREASRCFWLRVRRLPGSLWR